MGNARHDCGSEQTQTPELSQTLFNLCYTEIMKFRIQQRILKTKI